MDIFKMKSEFERSYYFLKLFLLTFISLIFIEFAFKLIAFKGLLGLELIRIILFSMGSSLLVAFLCSFLKEKFSKIIVLVFIFFVGFYSILQLTFNNLIGNYMSLNASSGGGLSRVVSQIPEFIGAIKLNYLICIIPFILLLIFFIKDKKIIKYEKPIYLRIVFFIIIIVIVKLLGVLSVNLDVFEDRNQIKSNKELYESPTLIELSLKQFGAFKFFERDLMYMFFPKNNYSLNIDKSVNKIVEEDYERKIDDTEFKKLIDSETNKDIKELHEYFINKSITPKNEYTGYFKDKNLVLVMIEAFDMIAINEQVTPTLYKMASDGWYFDNYYTPKYSCTTGESEYISETSIIPSSTVCTPNSYINNDYSTSIFNIFKNSGYYVSSYHSWTDEFYSRSKLHANMGSELYLDYKGLEMSNIVGWPLDSEMFNNSYIYYKDKDKFFTFIITSSTHFPYDVDTTVTKKHWDKVKNLDYPDKVKRYLAKSAELDESLKILIENLEKDNKLDDTVIVLFGDHHPLNMESEYLNKYSNIDRYENFNMDRLPFIIYNSELESKKVNKTASTFDILPTLANLFDLEYDPRFYMGIDTFSNEESIVIFTNGSWITDKCLYNSKNNTYKSLNQEELSDEYISNINKIVNDRFYVSNKILNLNYFKYRFIS